MIERLRKLLLIAYDSKEGEVPLKIPFFMVITINTYNRYRGWVLEYGVI